MRSYLPEFFLKQFDSMIEYSLGLIGLTLSLVAMSSAHNHDPDRHIKWDEEVIEEHNKERGTRQKVLDYRIVH